MQTYWCKGQAALHVSRQPNSDVQLGYLAHNQHRLSGDGSITHAEVSSILWVQEVVDMEDGQSKGRSAECSGLPGIKRPRYRYTLRDVIKALINTVHDSTTAGILTIGKLAVISFHGASFTVIANTVCASHVCLRHAQFLREFAYLTTFSARFNQRRFWQRLSDSQNEIWE